MKRIRGIIGIIAACVMVISAGALFTACGKKNDGWKIKITISGGAKAHTMTAQDVLNGYTTPEFRVKVKKNGKDVTNKVEVEMRCVYDFDPNIGSYDPSWMYGIRENNKFFTSFNVTKTYHLYFFVKKDYGEEYNNVYAETTIQITRFTGGGGVSNWNYLGLDRIFPVNIPAIKLVSSGGMGFHSTYGTFNYDYDYSYKTVTIACYTSSYVAPYVYHSTLLENGNKNR